MSGDATPGSGQSEPDRAAEAAVHLQRAAMEFIVAARVLLDIAEEAVREPAGVVAMVSDTVTALIGAATGAGQARPAGRAGVGRPASGPQRPGVEHIKVS
ncbi:MAG: hypothetical protein NVS3B21_30720 [Acidimicrobiales bacterium]